MVALNATINHATGGLSGIANVTKYNWKTSTIEAPKQSISGPSGSTNSKNYNPEQQIPPRPSSINKSVIGGGNFSTLDPVELINYNNKQRVFNSTIQQQYSSAVPDRHASTIQHPSTSQAGTLQKDSSKRGKTPQSIEVSSPDVPATKKSSTISSSINMSAIMGSSTGGAKIPQYNQQLQLNST